MKAYLGTTGLNKLISLIKSALALKLDTASVVNALNNTSTTAPLAAAQGKALNDKITTLTSTVNGKLNISDVVNTLNSELLTSALSAAQGKALNDKITALTGTVNGIKVPKVVDDLVTESADSALSANQGKVLNTSIQSLNSTIGTLQTAVNGKLSTAKLNVGYNEYDSFITSIPGGPKIKYVNWNAQQTGNYRPWMCVCDASGTWHNHMLYSDLCKPTAAEIGALPLVRTVTLASASWTSAKTITASVTGVSSTESTQLIIPAPAVAHQAAYVKAGILCTAQAANSLTFTYTATKPTTDLTVYVCIFDTRT